MNITDPSLDRLEAEIKIQGHENETKSRGKSSVNVNEPSVDDLERKIKIPGHDKEKQQVKQKLNLSEPSVDAVEKVLRVQGHNLSESSSRKRLNASIIEPSVDDAEKQLKVSGHENETAGNRRHFKMNPNVDKGMTYDNPRFKYAQMLEKRQQKLRHVVPSDDQLEKLIEITNGSLNEAPRINRTDILPSYEGFHGVLMHGDETFLSNNETLTSRKPADLDDFRKWMEKQVNVSKLERFKRLDDEFESLNKKMEDHDEFKRRDEDKDAAPREKLKRAIREIELEQEARKKRKIDL